MKSSPQRSLTHCYPAGTQQPIHEVTYFVLRHWVHFRLSQLVTFSHMHIFSIQQSFMLRHKLNFDETFSPVRFVVSWKALDRNGAAACCCASDSGLKWRQMCCGTGLTIRKKTMQHFLHSIISFSLLLVTADMLNNITCTHTFVVWVCLYLHIKVFSFWWENEKKHTRHAEKWILCVWTNYPSTLQRRRWHWDRCTDRKDARKQKQRI